MNNFFIKPKPGLNIRDPETFSPLAADGEEKPRSAYWLRRLNDGDVEVVTPATHSTRKSNDKE